MRVEITLFWVESTSGLKLKIKKEIINAINHDTGYQSRVIPLNLPYNGGVAPVMFGCW